MPLADLTEVERKVIRDCLRAAADGPFFPDWEFDTLFGLHRQEVRDIAFAAGPLDDARDDVRIAINNALNMLTGYPHRYGPDVWDKFIPVPPAAVRELLKKWKGSPTRGSFVDDVFKEMM
jgi:hypothetical protein